MEGEGKRLVLYRVTDVNDGDTIDATAQFVRVDDAYVTNATAPQAAVQIEKGPGTILTFRGPALNHDVCYVLVGGSAAE
jgi:hypothetical protein